MKSKQLNLKEVLAKDRKKQIHSLLYFYNIKYNNCPRKLKKQLNYALMTDFQLYKRGIRFVKIITHTTRRNGEIITYRNPKIILFKSPKYFLTLQESSYLDHMNLFVALSREIIRNDKKKYFIYDKKI